MFGKYKTAHLLGSTKGNEETFRHVEKALTKQGDIVFCPVFFDLKPDDPKLAMYNDMCYEKLKACDYCVVATPNHIGDSTANRIRQALSMEKPVFVWEIETDECWQIMGIKEQDNQYIIY